MKYNISTDAVTTTIEAASADEAAKKFAESESVFRGLHIATEEDLRDEATKMGGWANITEAE